MNHRLYRSRRNRVLTGVCGGVAEFFGLDATHVRVAWIVSSLFGGFSIVLYVILALIMQLDPASADAPAQPVNHPELNTSPEPKVGAEPQAA